MFPQAQLGGKPQAILLYSQQLHLLGEPPSCPAALANIYVNSKIRSALLPTALQEEFHFQVQDFSSLLNSFLSSSLPSSPPSSLNTVISPTQLAFIFTSLQRYCPQLVICEPHTEANISQQRETSTT